MDFGSISYAREGTEPQILALQPGVTTLGSSPDNDVVLQDAGIAAYHVRLVCTPTECWVMNIAVEQATFLNYVRMQSNARYPLQDGDLIRVGAFFVRYSQAEQPSEERIRLPQRRPAVLPPEIAGRLSEVGVAPRRTRLPARRLAGNLPPATPSVYVGERRSSSYLEALPPIYHDNDFLGRMLLIFEHILEPLDQQIGDLAFYFDPRTAPAALLPWLASWLDLVLNENWPLERRRALILAAAELYRWRGTRQGLVNYLRIYTGVTPTIIEPATSNDLPDHVFKVQLTLPKDSPIDQRYINMIIETEKPAHTACVVEIIEAP